MFARIDADNNGDFSKDEFLSFMKQKMTEKADKKAKCGAGKCGGGKCGGGK